MKSVKSDLYATNNLINNITEVIGKNEMIIKLISSFIFDSTEKLKGNGYDSVRNKMNLYYDALIKQNVLLNNLLNNVTSADNYLINYMQEYDELDDFKVEDIRKELSVIYGTINENKGLISYIKKHMNDSYLDTLGRLEGELATYEYQYGIKKRLFDILDGLSSADSKASSYINEISADISKYRNAVNEINVTAM